MHAWRSPILPPSTAHWHPNLPQLLLSSFKISVQGVVLIPQPSGSANPQPPSSTAALLPPASVLSSFSSTTGPWPSCTTQVQDRGARCTAVPHMPYHNMDDAPLLIAGPRLDMPLWNLWPLNANKKCVHFGVSTCVPRQWPLSLQRSVATRNCVPTQIRRSACGLGVVP